MIPGEGASEKHLDRYLPDVLLALTRLCLLYYEVDKKTTLKYKPPGARLREALSTLQNISFSANWMTRGVLF